MVFPVSLNIATGWAKVHPLGLILLSVFFAWPITALAQEDIARLSERAEHFIVEDSGHAIHLEKPDFVADRIKEMLQTVRAQ